MAEEKRKEEEERLQQERMAQEEEARQREEAKKQEEEEEVRRREEERQWQESQEEELCGQHGDHEEVVQRGQLRVDAEEDLQVCLNPCNLLGHNIQGFHWIGSDQSFTGHFYSGLINKQVIGLKSIHKDQVNWYSKYVTQSQQQRPESHVVILTWNACKYKVHKLHQRYTRLPVWKTYSDSDSPSLQQGKCLEKQ